MYVEHWSRSRSAVIKINVQNYAAADNKVSADTQRQDGDVTSSLSTFRAPLLLLLQRVIEDNFAIDMNTWLRVYVVTAEAQPSRRQGLVQDL